MTMHLIRGVTALNTRKPRFKMTKVKEKAWREDLANYNRELKRQGQPKLTWEQYVDMRLGKVQAPKIKFQPMETKSTQSWQDSREKFPSLVTDVGNTDRKESMVYDGERKLIGIAVLHKSCLQPVFSQQEAEEIAKMRRG